MPDMSNPVVSHVLIFLTGLVPLFVYLLANQRKKLGYAITRNFEIITVNKPEMADRITIFVDGKQTKALRSTEIILQNVGAKDIQDQAVQIIFSPPAEIINSQTAYDPPGFAPKFNLIPKNQIELVIPLMNPGDRITIHCLTANNSSGNCQVLAKGLNLTAGRFKPELFVSPTINGLVASFYVLVYVLCMIWLILRVIENPTGQPLWSQILTILFVLPISAGFAMALYEGTIRMIKSSIASFRKRSKS